MTERAKYWSDLVAVGAERAEPSGVLSAARGQGRVIDLVETPVAQAIGGCTQGW